ncbi:hypothetical protein [Kistimonas asteriae]|uniref:hypothetical protein n=1 Tax=Kistimonas asteriae TaxID=517724 RepID=UPI001BA6D0AB|nr:hypothetical protein [Kistimonas asteriae]
MVAGFFSVILGGKLLKVIVLYANLIAKFGIYSHFYMFGLRLRGEYRFYMAFGVSGVLVSFGWLL